jgi:hypothetical protein
MANGDSTDTTPMSLTMRMLHGSITFACSAVNQITPAAPRRRSPRPLAGEVGAQRRVRVLPSLLSNFARQRAS